MAEYDIRLQVDHQFIISFHNAINRTVTSSSNETQGKLVQNKSSGPLCPYYYFKEKNESKFNQPL